MTARTLVAAALLAAIGTALAQPPKPEPAPKPKAAPEPKAEAKAEHADLNKQLATRVTIEFNGPFKDAVKLMAEKFDLPLAVDPKVGEDLVGGAALCDHPADNLPIKLGRLANVRIDTVLKLISEQVGAKFLLYPDHIKIVPLTYAAYESGVLSATPDAAEEPLLSVTEMIRAKPLIKRGLVNANFKAKPLSEAIDEIAEATGATLAVSPLLPAAVRQTPVTVRFTNTPVDAAVRTLCEMTESGTIEDANVLLVTTRERAAARAKEEALKLKDRAPILGGCLGVGFGGGQPQADLATTVAELKEQNDKLRKELEELKKKLPK